jgi:hypothetical protein
VKSALPVRGQAGDWLAIDHGPDQLMPDAVHAEGLIGGEDRPEPDRLPRLIRSTWYIVSRRVEGHSNSRCCGRGRLHHSYYFAREPKPNSVALIPIFQSMLMH